MTVLGNSVHVAITTMARVVASLVMLPLLVDAFIGPHVFRVPIWLQASEENISIDYCTRCRWMLRSAWLAQELLTTFQDELDSVTLIPSRPPAPGGVFTVKRNGQLVWDRKEEGGFPESKELKQRVRDIIAPERSLGHSDKEEDSTTREDCVECNENDPVSTMPDEIVSEIVDAGVPKPNVGITYCTGCRWLLRAAWLAQELLTTFDTEIASVTLIPSRPLQKGGTFTVTLDENMLWDRAEQGRFPQPKELKQLIRDKVAPSKDLGHSDTHQEVGGVDAIDDDEAEEMRKFFGVM